MFFMSKKGDTWISAILYMALGIVAIALILSAGLPLIQNMRDRNTISQTKDIFANLDKSIRTVVDQGPGAIQIVPLTISSGELYVDADPFLQNRQDVVLWRLKTNIQVVEENYKKREGNLMIYVEPTLVKGQYWTVIELNYLTFADLTLNATGFGNPIMGSGSFSIKKTGKFSTDNRPYIDFTVS